MSRVKVFIDNSVAGYNLATETCLPRLLPDGAVSASTEVNAADLTAEAGGQVSFDINSRRCKLIDAVQLVMGRGEIKIPVIEFTSETDTLASDVQLDFTATLTDGDGDTATSAFAASLFANELSPAFDYVLQGEAGQADAFNIDLASTADAWRIDGYEVRAAPATRSRCSARAPCSIAQSGGNSVITVNERPEA